LRDGDVHLFVGSFVRLFVYRLGRSGRAEATATKVSEMFVDRQKLHSRVKFTLAAGAYSWHPNMRATFYDMKSS